MAVPPGETVTKARYRVINWKAYTAALVQRGSLTIWFAQDVLLDWRNTQRTGARARPQVYTDTAIACILTLQQVFHLRLRQTEGFVTSLLTLARVDLPVPDYTTLCRRRKTLVVRLPHARSAEPLHLVVDSTGLKIFGDGEWNVRQHGVSKRRTWRKVHLGVDEATQTILACVVTTNTIHDCEALPTVLGQVPDMLGQVTTDGAYDTSGCYAAIGNRHAQAVIPPRDDAVLHADADWAARNATITRIADIGRAAWKVAAHYHRRSLAETAMFRLKTLFGATLTSRCLAGQRTEATLRCAALNRMTQLGLPDSVRVVAA
jgi:IS5 family transposase